MCYFEGGNLMALSLNKVVKPQTVELNKKALLLSSENSPIKRRYVEGEKPKFTKLDMKYLLKNFKKIYRLPYTIYTTVKLIKKDHVGSNNYLTNEVFNEMEQLLEALQVDEYGFFEIAPEKLFKGCGVPHKYALVFSSAMNPVAFETSPSVECQVEVAKVYVETGDIANKVANFLQNRGFGASPNHSMGGQLDYSMAAQWAGIGIIGRHSMAITRKNGPCHRLSIVYTNIENLDAYIESNALELEWIKEFCKKCGKCIRNCPTGAILQEPLILDGFNPTRVDYEKCCQGFVNYGCGVCIKECPFTSGNYEKIKAAFQKNSERR